MFMMTVCSITFFFALLNMLRFQQSISFRNKILISVKFLVFLSQYILCEAAPLEFWVINKDLTICVYVEYLKKVPV